MQRLRLLNSHGRLVSMLPEILAHQPGTAILSIGANDLAFGYPAANGREIMEPGGALQANGVRVRHCLPTPETPTDHDR